MPYLGITDIKNDYINDWVGWHANENEHVYLFSDSSKLSNFASQVPVLFSLSIISTSSSQNKKKYDNLTDMFQSFAFLVRILQGNSATSPILFQP